MVRISTNSEPRAQRITSIIKNQNVLVEGSKKTRIKSEKGKKLEIQIAQKADRKGKRVAYTKALSINDNLTVYHTVFLTSAHTEQKRICIADLPAPPKSWKQLLSYSKKEEFMTACGIEIRDFESKDIFYTINIPTNMTMNNFLPLIWVFMYKSDSDRFLIKYKARLVVRRDLYTIKDETYTATVFI